MNTIDRDDFYALLGGTEDKTALFLQGAEAAANALGVEITGELPHWMEDAEWLQGELDAMCFDDMDGALSRALERGREAGRKER